MGTLLKDLLQRAQRNRRMVALQTGGGMLLGYVLNFNPELLVLRTITRQGLLTGGHIWATPGHAAHQHDGTAALSLLPRRPWWAWRPRTVLTGNGYRGVLPVLPNTWPRSARATNWPAARPRPRASCRWPSAGSWNAPSVSSPAFAASPSTTDIPPPAMPPGSGWPTWPCVSTGSEDSQTPSKTVNKIAVLFLILFCFGSCISQSKKQQQYEDERSLAFKEYMTDQKITFKELNDSIYSAQYGYFLKHEKKLKLEANPYLKVNKVYVHYRTPTSVEFTVYSDEETFCINTFDLDVDGKILSFPENGVIKVLAPIRVEDFGDFEITENIIKTRKRHKTSNKEWYEYVNGSIKNDTIHFTEKYTGTNDYKFKKNWLAKTRTTYFKEVYQPLLKAKKYKNDVGLICYEVAGEFNVEK